MFFYSVYKILFLKAYCKTFAILELVSKKFLELPLMDSALTDWACFQLNELCWSIICLVGTEQFGSSCSPVGYQFAIWQTIPKLSSIKQKCLSLLVRKCLSLVILLLWADLAYVFGEWLVQTGLTCVSGDWMTGDVTEWRNHRFHPSVVQPSHIYWQCQHSWRQTETAGFCEN